MNQITIQLNDNDYRHLMQAAKYSGKSIEEMVHEWITQLPDMVEDSRIINDPLFQMEGYDSDAPADLSIRIDEHLYTEDYPK